MMPTDTIAAVSTPAGVGGVALLRVSGPDALAIASALLEPNELLRPRRATLRRMAGIDEGIATYYPAPHSYTGEDTVELACHGSRYVQQALLQALLDSGARLAEPGEFTRRALANGKMDLSQAEAVADLIDAATPAQHRLAVSQLRGGYADELKRLRQQLVELTSLLELELDFSQEDVEFADRAQLRALVNGLDARLGALVSSFRTGNALKRGVAVAIVGRPNAGKSSLLNALLDDDRAIVSSVAGTTRDTVEELFSINGVPFRLIDTAGLRRTSDPIELQGVERSRKAAERADIILLVHDSAQGPVREDELNETPADRRTLTVYSKADLPEAEYPQGALAVSTLTGQGLDRLRAAIVEGYGEGDGEVMVSNVRHYEALLRVRQSLLQVADGMEAGMPADLLAVDLRDALYHLGTITGEVTSEELLQSIFSRFCVGK